MRAEPDLDRSSPERTTTMVRVDGERLRVRVTGDGTPLLLVMGLGGHLEMWQPFEAALVPLGFRTIAFDAPGTGDSAPPRRLRRMSGLADLVAALLDQLGLDRLDVLGVSFGGAVAQELAHRHPARVRRLVLAATSCGLGSWPGDPWSTAMLFSPLGYVARARPSGMRRLPSPTGWWSQLYAATGWSSRPWLATLPQPTLVLAGDLDDLVPVANGRQLAEAIPDARLQVMKGGGHMFLVRDPATSADAVVRFLTTAR